MWAVGQVACGQRGHRSEACGVSKLDPAGSVRRVRGGQTVKGPWCHLRRKDWRVQVDGHTARLTDPHQLVP